MSTQRHKIVFRLCIASYDEDLYYNPDAVPFVFRYSKRATTLSELSV